MAKPLKPLQASDVPKQGDDECVLRSVSQHSRYGRELDFRSFHAEEDHVLTVKRPVTPRSSPYQSAANGRDEALSRKSSPAGKSSPGSSDGSSKENTPSHRVDGGQRNWLKPVQSGPNPPLRSSSLIPENHEEERSPKVGALKQGRYIKASASKRLTEKHKSPYSKTASKYSKSEGSLNQIPDEEFNVHDGSYAYIMEYVGKPDAAPGRESLATDQDYGAPIENLNLQDPTLRSSTPDFLDQPDHFPSVRQALSLDYLDAVHLPTPEGFGNESPLHDDEGENNSNHSDSFHDLNCLHIFNHSPPYRFHSNIPEPVLDENLYIDTNQPPTDLGSEDEPPSPVNLTERAAPQSEFSKLGASLPNLRLALRAHPAHSILNGDDLQLNSVKNGFSESTDISIDSHQRKDSGSEVSSLSSSMRPTPPPRRSRGDKTPKKPSSKPPLPIKGLFTEKSKSNTKDLKTDLQTHERKILQGSSTLSRLGKSVEVSNSSATPDSNDRGLRKSGSFQGGALGVDTRTILNQLPVAKVQPLSILLKDTAVRNDPDVTEYKALATLDTASVPMATTESVVTMTTEQSLTPVNILNEYGKITKQSQDGGTEDSLKTPTPHSIHSFASRLKTPNSAGSQSNDSPSVMLSDSFLNDTTTPMLNASLPGYHSYATNTSVIVEDDYVPAPALTQNVNSASAPGVNESWEITMSKSWKAANELTVKENLDERDSETGTNIELTDIDSGVVLGTFHGEFRLPQHEDVRILSGDPGDRDYDEGESIFTDVTDGMLSMISDTTFADRSQPVALWDSNDVLVWLESKGFSELLPMFEGIHT